MGVSTAICLFVVAGETVECCGDTITFFYGVHQNSNVVQRLATSPFKGATGMF